MTVSVSIGSRIIDIITSAWSGRETILVEGTVVSQKRTFGWLSTHEFVLEEEGAPVRYVVVVGGPVGYRVERNGIVVASHDHPVLTYFMAAGVIMGVLWGIELGWTLIAGETGSARFAAGLEWLRDFDIVVALLGGLVLAHRIRSRLRRSAAPALA
jgi:hypothetical protein